MKNKIITFLALILAFGLFAQEVKALDNESFEEIFVSISDNMETYKILEGSYNTGETQRFAFSAEQVQAFLQPCADSFQSQACVDHLILCASEENFERFPCSELVQFIVEVCSVDGASEDFCNTVNDQFGPEDMNGNDSNIDEDNNENSSDDDKLRVSIEPCQNSLINQSCDENINICLDNRGNESDCQQLYDYIVTECQNESRSEDEDCLAREDLINELSSPSSNGGGGCSLQKGSSHQATFLFLISLISFLSIRLRKTKLS